MNRRRYEINDAILVYLRCFPLLKVFIVTGVRRVATMKEMQTPIVSLRRKNLYTSFMHCSYLNSLMGGLSGGNLGNDVSKTV